MTRVPVLPSRLKAISMPSARSDVCARRRRPARARGVFGQSARPAHPLSAEASAPARSRSDAFPVQLVREAMIRDRIGLHYVLDSGLAVHLIGVQECAGGPERRFA